jgi:hypothetical protein
MQGDDHRPRFAVVPLVAKYRNVQPDIADLETHVFILSRESSQRTRAPWA